MTEPESQPRGVEPLPKLLPCPFCGGAAIKGMFNVWCDACGAESASDVDDTHEQVINRWNARADLSRATGELSDERARALAREIIGNVNSYAEDNGELSISAFRPLAKRIAAALVSTRRATGETTVESALAELWDLIDLRCEITFQTGGWIVITVWANSIIPMELFRVRRPTLDDCMVEVREWASVRAASRTAGEGEK